LIIIDNSLICDKTDDCMMIATTPLGICIPRIDSLIISKENIKTTFQKTLGSNECIKNIVFINNRDNSHFKKVYIYLNFWPNNDKSQYIRKQLLDNIQLKIMFNDPLFWRCSMIKT
jgi:hypothetical protein